MKNFIKNFSFLIEPTLIVSDDAWLRSNSRLLQWWLNDEVRCSINKHVTCYLIIIVPAPLERLFWQRFFGFSFINSLLMADWILATLPLNASNKSFVHCVHWWKKFSCDRWWSKKRDETDEITKTKFFGRKWNYEAKNNIERKQPRRIFLKLDSSIKNAFRYFIGLNKSQASK